MHSLAGPAFARGVITYTVVTLLAISSVAGEVIDRNHRNSFLSPELQKKYFSIEAQTLRFLDRQTSGVNGLVESFRGTSSYSYDLFTRAFCYGRGGVLDCQSFTYDGAIAAIAYLVAGKPEKTRKILSVYRKEFYRVKDDTRGYYNSYRTDRVDRAGLVAGVDGDRIHVGPAMWVAIAALHYTAVTGDLQYLSLAIDTVRWARDLGHYPFPDGGRGAVCMGYGWGPDWSKVYSTENNIDYYAVLSMLSEIYAQGDQHVRAVFSGRNLGPAEMDGEMEAVLRWIDEVAYNEEGGYFNCGYNEKGVDPTHALDTESWAIAGFGPGQLEDLEIDPFGLLAFAERRYVAKDIVAGERVEGFDFTDTHCRGRATKIIWGEGTGQQIVAYQVMARYAEKRGRTEEALACREKAIRYADDLEKIARGAAIIDGALPYTSKCPGEKQIILTFETEWEIPRGNKGQWVGSVSSTVWRYFALAGFNPLVFDTETVSYPLLR